MQSKETLNEEFIKQKTGYELIDFSFAELHHFLYAADNVKNESAQYSLTKIYEIMRIWLQHQNPEKFSILYKKRLSTI